MLRRRRVQHLPVRMAPLRQGVVVVALGPDPLPCGYVIIPDIGLDALRNVRPAGAPLQGYLQKSVGHGEKMAVGIQEGGHDCPTRQIHPLRVPRRLSRYRLPGPHGGDAPVPHQQGLGSRHPLLHGEDGAVFKEILHTQLPFRCDPACTLFTVYPIGDGFATFLEKSAKNPPRNIRPGRLTL